MPVEVLLLLFVFIVLPLIEQAVRKARQERERAASGGRAPAPARPAPVRRVPDDWDEEEEEEEMVVVARPQVPPPLPPAPVAAQPVPRQGPPRPPPPRPAPVRRPLPREVRLAQISRMRQMADAGPPAAATVQRRHALPLPELRTTRSLRRAIVLQAVLGPCRANDPYI
jgi:hypothetical protein